MSTDPQDAPRRLPDRPNLRHLKDQAKDLVDAGAAPSITAAQFAYRPPLRLSELAQAQGPCGVPRSDRSAESGDRWERSRARPVADDPEARAARGTARLREGRAAHVGRRVPRALGAPEPGAPRDRGMDDRARLGRAPGRRRPADARRAQRLARTDDGTARGARRRRERAVGRRLPDRLRAVRSHGSAGARVAAGSRRPAELRQRARTRHGARLRDGTYARWPERLSACIDLLLAAGGTKRYDAPGVLDILRGRLDRLAERLDADPGLVHRRFPELDCGGTGGRRLLLRGATLLHVAAEFGRVDAVRLLLDRGADVTREPRGRRRRRRPDGALPRGHAMRRCGPGDAAAAVEPAPTRRPRDCPATTSGRTVRRCTPLGYALRFLEEPPHAGENATVAFLRARGAVE